MAGLVGIELTDLVYDEARGGYWLRPISERETKRCQSPAEVAFWNAAFALLPGLQKQYRIAPTRYRFDFALPEHQIGIEIDGHNWHSTRQQRQHDAKRDRILQGLGWRVLRFAAAEVTRNADECAKEVLDLLKKCTLA